MTMTMISLFQSALCAQTSACLEARVHGPRSLPGLSKNLHRARRFCQGIPALGKEVCFTNFEESRCGTVCWFVCCGFLLRVNLGLPHGASNVRTKVAFP